MSEHLFRSYLSFTQSGGKIEKKEMASNIYDLGTCNYIHYHSWHHHARKPSGWRLVGFPFYDN